MSQTASVFQKYDNEALSPRVKRKLDLKQLDKRTSSKPDSAFIKDIITSLQSHRASNLQTEMVHSANHRQRKRLLMSTKRLDDLKGNRSRQGAMEMIKSDLPLFHVQQTKMVASRKSIDGLHDRRIETANGKRSAVHPKRGSLQLS